MCSLRMIDVLTLNKQLGKKEGLEDNICTTLLSLY